MCSMKLVNTLQVLFEIVMIGQGVQVKWHIDMKIQFFVLCCEGINDK